MSAVSSATNTPVQLVRDFIDGFVGGAHGKSSIASMAGDLVGSVIPGYGQGRAVGDVWEGIKSGDTARTVAGLIGLIPMAGGATKGVTEGGKAALKVASSAVAEKGFKAGSLHLASKLTASAKTAVTELGKNKEVRDQLAKAGERAYGRAMELIQEKVLTMAAEGKAPDVELREHKSFTEARKAAFSELDITSPDKTWQNLYADDETRGRHVVGKHKPVPMSGDIEDQISTLGFRFIQPDVAPAEGEKGRYQMMWWKHADKASDPSFGLESFEASSGEAQKIFDAYLNSSKTFGRVKSKSN
jgi:hypothetical protein